jgi:hypothetical protein
MAAPREHTGEAHEPERGVAEEGLAIIPTMLRVSAIVELATGCALLATPSVVIQALIGSPSNQIGWIVARIPGDPAGQYAGETSHAAGGQALARVF